MQRFVEGLRKFGKDKAKISNHIKTRNISQVRSKIIFTKMKT